MREVSDARPFALLEALASAVAEALIERFPAPRRASGCASRGGRHRRRVDGGDGGPAPGGLSLDPPICAGGAPV